MADLIAKIGADVTDFDRKMKGVEASMKEVGERMQSVGKTLSMSLTAPLLALGGVALKAFDTQIKAEKKLQAALRATGQDVESNFKDMAKFATQLQKVSLIGDESTLQMLQLATSMGLGAESAKRASKNAIAMASALGINEQSAIKMTAALEQGDATMLTRYLPSLRGITDQSERAEEAQRLLAQMFGTVTAEAEDGLGPMIQMTNTVGDLMEQFGAIIADGIKPFVNGIKGMAERFQALSPHTKELIVKIGAIVAAVGPLMVALGFLISTVLPALGGALLALTGPVALVVGAIGLAVFEIQRNWDDIVKYFTTGPAADAWREFQKLTDKVFGALPDSIGGSSETITKIWDTLVEGFITPIKENFERILNIAMNFMGAFGDVIDAGQAAMSGDWETFWNEMKSIVIRIFSGMITGVTLGVNSMLGIVGSLVSFFDEDWGKALEKAQTSVDDFAVNLIDKAGAYIGFKKDVEAATEAVEGLSMTLASGGVGEDAPTAPSGGGETKKAKVVDETDINLLKQFSDQLGIAQEKAKVFGEEGLPLMQTELDLLRQTIEQGIETKSTDATALAALGDSYDILAAKIKLKQEEIAASNQALSINFGDMFANVATSFATGIGTIMAGTATMGDVLKGVLGVFLEFGATIGKLMIKLGVAGIAAKKLALSPVTAIAAGIALVAITGAASAALSKGPGGGGGGSGGTQRSTGSSISAFAKGTNFAPGGPALVGEEGPEIVNLPRGSQVIPNNKIGGMGGGGQMQLLTRITAQDIEIILKRKKRSDGFA